MIYAVPCSRYQALAKAGVLSLVQHEVQSDDMASLAKRVAKGELVEAKDADRHAAGQRDRCYLCGDEVTPFHWGERRVVYFMHLSNRNCIGKPGNPRARHQPDS